MIVTLLLNIVAFGSYMVANTSMFGNCFLHMKRFCDSPITVDVTSIFVLPTRIQAINQPMVSIFNENKTGSITQEGRIREECSLQIIIGFAPRDSKLLYSFMYFNYYTYLSRPYSIYVLVLDLLQNLTLHKPIITLPSSIFVLIFPPSYLPNQTALHSSPSYFYVCLSCRVLQQPVTNNRVIRFPTEFSYQKW
jgi:hypothetical protein